MLENHEWGRVGSDCSGYRPENRIYPRRAEPEMEKPSEMMVIAYLLFILWGFAIGLLIGKIL